MFPIMLHNQMIRSGGFSQRIQLTDVSEVELHELSEPTPDGSYTAVVSFTWQPSMQPFDVKVRVTYKKLAGENMIKVMRAAEYAAERLQGLRGPNTATIEQLDGSVS